MMYTAVISKVSKGENIYFYNQWVHFIKDVSLLCFWFLVLNGQKREGLLVLESRFSLPSL